MVDTMNNGVRLLMSDAQAFVEFAEGGMYSGSEVLSLPEKPKDLALALLVYILSTAMSKNGWFALFVGPIMLTFTD